MWQRIQSLYVALVALWGVLMFLFPVAEFNGYSAAYIFKLSGVDQVSGVPDDHGVNSFILLLLPLFAIESMVVAGVTFFLYKNRQLQIRLGKLNILSLTFQLVMVFLIIEQIKVSMENPKDVLVNYGLSSIIPILSIIFTWLANRAIRRDEEKVKTADRIR